MPSSQRLIGDSRYGWDGYHLKYHHSTCNHIRVTSWVQARKQSLSQEQAAASVSRWPTPLSARVHTWGSTAVRKTSLPAPQRRSTTLSSWLSHIPSDFVVDG